MLAENKNSCRIKKTEDYKNLYKTGRRVYPNSWIVVNFKNNKLQSYRYGLTVPKYVGNAVVRNRLKRLCREVFQKSEVCKSLPPVDINFVFKKRDPGLYKNLSFEELKNELEKACKRINKYHK